jgi:hypothetical protein
MFLLSRRELLALTLLFVVSLPAVTSRLYSSDEVQYFSYLRSLYFDRDVSFENEYRYFHDRNIAQSAGFHETFLERTTAAGRRVNYATMGCAMLWLPFYAAADVAVRVTGSAEADGFSKPYVRAVAYGSAFYGFLAILLSIRAARGAALRSSLFADRHGGQPKSTEFDGVFWAGVAVWLGTPLLFYMYVAPPFSHAVSAFGVALFVNVWLHVRQRWSAGGTFVLGLCAALLAMIREQDVFVALGPAVDFALALSTANFKRQTQNGALLWVAVAGVAGFVVGYLPQLLAYNALNGYPGPASHVARKMFWYSPHGLQVLFSPHHGFFFWTPLALAAIVGLVLLALRAGGDARRVAFCALIMVASQIYVAGSVASWTVAGAFGQRRFVCLTAVLVMGLAGLFAVAGSNRLRQGFHFGASRHGGQAGGRDDGAYVPAGSKDPAYVRSAVLVVAVVCVWWNIALMFQFATGLMDRQRLEPARNAYHAFVTVPIEAPSLVLRYLTNRESFYRPPARTP